MSRNSRLASDVPAQRRVDEAQGPAGQPLGVRMDREVVPVREPEQADQVHRIALEGVLRAQVHPAVVDPEILRLHGGGAEAVAEPADPAVEHRRALGVARLQLRADDGGEVAHVLGDAEIGLHEALDAREAAPGLVAEALGDPRLQAEGQALLRPLGREVHVAADPPQELLAALEQRVFLRREQPGTDEFDLVAHPVGVLGDPEQRVQVAQAALAVLDVGLDEVARGPGLRDAQVPLAQLRLHELGRPNRPRARRRSASPVPRRGPRAEQVPRLQQGRADRHVGPRLAHALLHGARGMADLQLQVPQDVEHRPRRRSPTTRSACRAAGTADRCPSPAPSCPGRSRRWRPRRAARRWRGCRWGRAARPRRRGSPAPPRR